MKKLEILSREYIFEEDAYFPSCHASTLVRLAGGGVLAACFGGRCEGAADVSIWTARSKSGGGFEAPVRVCLDDSLPHWNPVLFRGGNGGFSDEIILYFKVGKRIPEWKTYYCVSRDDGRSWSEIRELVPGDENGGRGPVKNKPVRLSDGSWLAPRSVETESDWTVALDSSDDGGKTWRTLPPLTYRSNPTLEQSLLTRRPNGIIQPSIWESGNGEVHMLMRSTWGRLYRSDSADLGRSWSEAYETAIPNNNSGIDLDRMSDGTVALCLNPLSDIKRRYPLCVYLSEGGAFEEALVLEDEPGEYSYPAVVADGETLHITYTWKRRNIVYVKAAAKS